MTSPRLARGRGQRWWLALIVAALLLAAGAAGLWWLSQRRAVAPEVAVSGGEPDSAIVPAGTRSVQLVFGSGDGLSPIVERRELPVRDRLEDELRAALAALCAGPYTRGAVSTLPRGTRVEGVYYDERQGAVLIDFSRELRANHPGGSAAERATVDAILRTIALNFPELRACTLLVGGTQVETLAGHVALDRPLDPRRWL